MRGEDFEIYKGKTFASLLKDIYDNSARKRKDLDQIIQNIDDQIKTTNDAVNLGEIVQRLIDTSIKNDDQLVKMAQIVQRMITLEVKEASASNDIAELISDEERNQLIANSHKAALSLVQSSQELEDDIMDLKNKIG